jgi:hypothetical protein
MARWWNVGKDGTVFVNCLKPAKNILLWAKNSPLAVKVAAAAVAGVVVVGGIAYYVCKKTVPSKENPS